MRGVLELHSQWEYFNSCWERGCGCVDSRSGRCLLRASGTGSCLMHLALGSAASCPAGWIRPIPKLWTGRFGDHMGKWLSDFQCVMTDDEMVFVGTRQ
jgi:hypothetical protein